MVRLAAGFKKKKRNEKIVEFFPALRMFLSSRPQEQTPDGSEGRRLCAVKKKKRRSSLSGIMPASTICHGGLGSRFSAHIDTHGVFGTGSIDLKQPI